MKENISCISIYSNTKNVEQAIKELESVNCDFRHVSVIAKYSQSENKITDYLGEQKKFWNNLWSLLTVSEFFIEPEFGSLIVAGKMVEIINNSPQITAIDDALSLLGRALFIIGVPVGNINEYEQEIIDENILLLVHGDQDDVERACKVLHGETQQVTVHRA